MRFEQQVRARSPRRGVTTVEYVLLLTVVLGGAFLGTCYVGEVTRKQLSVVSHPRGRAAASREMSRVESASREAYNPVASAMPTWQWLGIAVIVGFNLLLWFALIRRAREPVEEEAPEDRTASKNALFHKPQDILKVMSNNMDCLLSNQFRVRHVMSHRIASVEPDCSLAEAKQKMRDLRIRHLLVCTSDGKLVGLVSNRDIGRQSESVKDVMATDLVTTTSDAELVPTITTFLVQNISCLPVIEDGRCCGVLTTTDVMMAFQCALTLVQQEHDGCGRHDEGQTDNHGAAVGSI